MNQCLKCYGFMNYIPTTTKNSHIYKCKKCMLVYETIVYKISPECDLPIEEILKSVRQKPIDFKKIAS